ncbi:MAG: prepilin-type N-terminal cleavage/methylation domain-containing protein [Planctomycetota bacterium]|nr:MAG: prepilin-type N-terminal cleavage/methylation domain-containing protein [Planctomycetota bacterium]
MRQKPRSGFTLIEVLVVVAIIALLAAILLPALRNARTQAKIASCQVNCKQIGNMTGIYRSEYKGYVPVIFNADSNGDLYYFEDADPSKGEPGFPPARTCWLSVAFRYYTKGTAKMPPWLPDPANERWTDDLFDRYQDEILPDFYICPFVRGTGNNWEFTGSRVISGVQPAVIYDVWNWRGRHESYHTWKWNGITIRNMVPNNGRERLHHPMDRCGVEEVCDTIGRPKYSAFSWNMHRSSKPGSYGGAYLQFIDQSWPRKREVRYINMHRKLSVGEARRVKASCLSEVTIVYCAQGNRLGREPSTLDKSHRVMYNEDSHRTSKGAGTNTVFADGHVEWVNGNRIGWQ